MPAATSFSPCLAHISFFLSVFSGGPHLCGLENSSRPSRPVSAFRFLSGFLRVSERPSGALSRLVSPRATELGGNSGGRKCQSWRLREEASSPIQLIAKCAAVSSVSGRLRPMIAASMGAFRVLRK
jgi:hypothetical protein